MPLHRYKCLSCKNEFEEIQKFSDEPLKVCEACGAESLERMRGKVSFLLKGGSWAKDGYSATSVPQAVDGGAPAAEGSAPDDTNFKDVCDRTRKAIIKREYGIDVD